VSLSDDAALREEIRSRAPNWPDHPVLCTFAAVLPFPLRLTDGGLHKLELLGDFANPAEAGLFPGRPFVQIRIHNAPTSGLQFEPVTTAQALQSLYGAQLPDLEPVGEAYEQWVSLETPSPRLTGESTDDPAYAFHRCLGVLDLFLRSHNMVFHDPHVYPIATQELSRVIFVGEYEVGDGDWQFKFSMLAHPDRLPAFTEHDSQFGSQSAALNWGFGQLVGGHPFTRSVLLAIRANRAGQIRGDRIDEVISLQTAMESRLYATWRMVLVDKGLSAAKIETEVGRELAHRTVVLTVFPKLLGGRWDATAVGTPVGDYWQRLYMLRNRVVHAGYEPPTPEAEAARSAYDQLRYFIRERAWERRHDYPRTAVVVIGRDGMSDRGWSDPSFDQEIAAMLKEPTPFFLPWDIAGRPRP
jgi:hypothetical protein